MSSVPLGYPSVGWPLGEAVLIFGAQTQRLLPSKGTGEQRSLRVPSVAQPRFHSRWVEIPAACLPAACCSTYPPVSAPPARACLSRLSLSQHHQHHRRRCRRCRHRDRATVFDRPLARAYLPTFAAFQAYRAVSQPNFSPLGFFIRLRAFRHRPRTGSKLLCHYALRPTPPQSALTPALQA